MAETLQVFGQLDLGAGADTDLYTVPALSTLVISKIIFANRNNSVIRFRCAFRVGGGGLANKDYVRYDEFIIPYGASEICTGVTLQAGTVITVRSNTANVSASVYGDLVT